MGLIDTPLVSEMDALEKKARKGDIEALEKMLLTTSPLVRHAVRRFQERDGMPIREAMKKAGVAIVCIR